MCTSLNPVTPAVWCDENCQLQPDAESCSGFCKCPKRRASDGATGSASGVVYGGDAAEDPPEPEGPPPPEPRIIGGWTNCGPDSGVEEWYATHGSDPSLAGRRLICHTLTCAPRFGQAGEVGAES